MSQSVKNEFGKVAVLMGGWSGERVISLLGGAAVLEGLIAAGVDAVGIDVDRDISAVLKAGNFDRAFNILHGRGGEDGVIQGVLETLQIPYTGSGVMASALSMDKLITKRIWRSAGMATPLYMLLSATTDWKAVVKALGLPLMVKPACEGSSLGLTKVDSVDELKAAWQTAEKLEGDVFAEQWITGREFTIGILNGKALPVIELKTDNIFYDYEAKYESDETQYFCPCDLDEGQQTDMRKQSMQAFNVLGASNWGRIDVMQDMQGKNWLIELNTIPGMTSHSLVPMAAKVDGLSFSALVCEILRGSVEGTEVTSHG